MFVNERKILSLCVIILVCWGASLKTLAPTIYIEDSGQFVSSASTLGHNHPPGYILYNLLAHPLTRLPLGEIAFRVNLFSCMGGVGALCFLFWLTSALFKDSYVVIFTSLLLVFSRSFWFLNSQSEVYQLNLMFFGGALYWLWLAKNRSGKAFTRLLYLWLGMGFNNHYLLILFTPLIILFEFSGDHGFSLKASLTRMNFLFLGFWISLALPLRSAGKALMDWGHPNNWNRFFQLLRRTQFKHLEFSRPVAFVDKLNFIGHFFQELAGQFYIITLILALFGVYWLYRKHSRWLSLLVSIWLLGGIGVIFLLQFPFNFENMTRVSVYYLPIFWLTAIFIGAGLKYFKDKEPFNKKWQLIFLLLPLGIGIINFPQVNLRNNYLGFDQGYNLLINLPNKATLFAQGNNIVFPLSYVQHVLKKRPDIIIYDQNDGVFPLGDPNFKFRSGPQLFTLMREKPPNLKTILYGLLFRKSDHPLKFTNERYFRWRYQNL